MIKFDLKKEIENRESKIQVLVNEVESLKKTYFLLSNKKIEKDVEISPKKEGKERKSLKTKRRDARGELLEFFLSHEKGQQFRKSELAKATGISDGSIQNVLSPPNNKPSDYESIRIGPSGRNLKWRLKLSVWNAKKE